ncbi:hypothetical protein [Sphingobacterium sp.]|nr:hypothetical protein [Sphingobacterium sp.]
MFYPITKLDQRIRGKTNVALEDVMAIDNWMVNRVAFTIYGRCG